MFQLTKLCRLRFYLLANRKFSTESTSTSFGAKRALNYIDDEWRNRSLRSHEQREEAATDRNFTESVVETSIKDHVSFIDIDISTNIHH